MYLPHIFISTHDKKVKIFLKFMIISIYSIFETKFKVSIQFFQIYHKQVTVRFSISPKEWQIN